MIHSTEYQTFDSFFWVLSAARVREMISIWCGNQAPKKRTKIYMHSMIHTLGIPHSIHAVGRPWSRLLQPPIGCGWGCTATSQVRHRGSLIPDLEAIDQAQISQIQKKRIGPNQAIDQVKKSGQIRCQLHLPKCQKLPIVPASYHG